jgi:hypothetical protein
VTAPKDDADGIRQTFLALKGAGWGKPSVWDGEEETPVANEDEAVKIITGLDMAHLYVKREVAAQDGEGEPTTKTQTAWVFFVLGNSPEEVICDHTVSLSYLIDPLTDGWFEE